MQPRYMSTKVFLRLEKEWQHMRHAARHLELEAERPRSDCTAEPEPATSMQTQQTKLDPSHNRTKAEVNSCVGDRASPRA